MVIGVGRILVCCSQRQETCGGTTRSDASASHISSLTHKRRSQSHSHCTTFTSVRPVLLQSIIRQGHLSTLLHAYLWKKTSLEWGKSRCCRDSARRLAMYYRPSAHSLPLSPHFLQNTPPRALSLQHCHSRTMTKRTAPTCIFAIFDHSPLYERHGQKSE